MLKIVFLLLMLSLSLLSFEIDISDLESNLTQNNINDRLLLTKYYLKHQNIKKAKKYNDEVLKLSPKNKTAKKFQKKIVLYIELIKLLHAHHIKDINKYYKELYLHQKYQKIRDLSKYLKIMHKDYPKLITARIFMWDGLYKRSNTILKDISNKNSQDYIEIKAYNCFYLAHYKCAKENFSMLYSATYKLEYALKLIDTYFFLNELDKANTLIQKLAKAFPKNRQVQKKLKKISLLKSKELDTLTKQYEKSKNFSDLQKLVNLLLSTGKKSQAYSYLEEYIKENPDDNNAQYWYATYLSWDGQNEKAFTLLEKIPSKNNYKVKLLMAKILAWNGNYIKSINYLNDIISNSHDKNLILDSYELMGLIYYWKQDYKKAKPLLQKVVKAKNSIESNEALMVMSGNIKPLIKKYKLLHKKEPLNLDYILKIAQYSESIKDIDSAIIYYEKYYKLKPKPNIAHTLAKLYLVKKNAYKAFGYYEYWAYQKNSEDSLLELATAYFQNGYNKSSLDVITEILKRYPESQKAIDLKAQILKLNPKFTQHNSNKNLQEILNTKSTNLLKMANRLYFNGFYKQASQYYKKYILDNPNDYKVREHYAYSLEFSQAYKEASAEFFLLTWMKKDCDLMYHYAYNLEKSKQKKKALSVYNEAKGYALKPLPKKLKNFLEKWKSAWESQNINRYKSCYTQKFSNNRLWLLHKENIFKSVNFISIYLSGESLISTKKVTPSTSLYKIKIYQQYTTNKKQDHGYKILTLQCQGDKCLIKNEAWQSGEYTPPSYTCYSRINKRVELLQKKKAPTITMQRLLSQDKNTTHIFIDKTLKKNVQATKTVLIPFEVNTTKNFFIPHPQKKKTTITQNNIVNNTKNNRLGFLADYFNDSSKISLFDYGLYYRHTFNSEWSLYSDIRKWKLYDPIESRNGEALKVHAIYKQLTFGAEVGKYKNFDYFHPYLEYDSYLNYKLFKNIVGKEQKTFCAVDRHLSSWNFIASKYIAAKTHAENEIADYWSSLTLSKKSDDNFVITPQFLYRFPKESKPFKTKELYLYYYISGWYTYNTQPSSCYYSPKFQDSTLIEVHPIYKKLELIGKYGYSFKGNSSLYSYGFNYKYNNLLTFNCTKNNSYRNNTSEYSYTECSLDVGAEW